MLFDADQVHASLEQPAFKAGGKVFKGRVLSAWEISQHQGLWDELAKGKDMDPSRITSGMERLVKQMFGFWAWRRFRKLHPMIQVQAVVSFMKVQANVVKATSLGLTESGKPSPVPRSDS